MVIFAKRLKTEREKLKHGDPRWTQEYVAELIGVARPTYTAYENGTKLPPMETLNNLADYLNVSVDYLLGRTNRSQPTDQLDLTSKEQAEFKTFINNPEHGIFFKDYLSASEERKEEMRKIFRVLQESEKGRKSAIGQGD
ncbi:helix-turn-helix domain-containing protein [Fontibacillus sp. BL9]|uniref:helix-turn-helix domain-containing protein n=1 Tax=Fontibacillus sp. BL9 TaxID=3389971 RepID=UPI00397CEC5B